MSKALIIQTINQYLADLDRRGLLPRKYEICGYCSEAGEVKQCEPHRNGNEQLMFSANDAVMLTTGRKTIWHTHIENGVDCLSFRDIDTALDWQLPVYMYKVSNGRTDYYDPLEALPYEGRPWAYTHSNCYSLYRDFAKRELGIELRDIRMPSPTPWDDPNWNQWSKNLGPEGFCKVAGNDLSEAKLKRGDLLLFGGGGQSEPGHCGILYDVEGNKILHQRVDRPSKIVEFGRHWRGALDSVWRHKDAVS